MNEVMHGSVINNHNSERKLVNLFGKSSAVGYKSMNSGTVLYLWLYIFIFETS